MENIFLIIAAVVAIGLMFYFLMKSKKEKSTPSSEEPEETEETKETKETEETEETTPPSSSERPTT